jgi:methylenetetrahydrofolate dehydrogenase (NADP+)/methenyltetrahydrofolate cyclohydrolase
MLYINYQIKGGNKMNNIIDAREIEPYAIHELKESIKQIEECLGHKPRFIIANASDNEANKRYIKAKVKMAEQLGLEAVVVEFEEEITDEEIIRYISFWSDEYIPIIVQLPIYSHLNKEAIFEYIDSHIDADGFSNEWIGKTYTSNATRVQPATPKGVMALLDYYEVEYEGKVALVIGRGKHTGQMLANMLINEGATVITTNSHTKDLYKLTKEADIIISCVGKPNLITNEDIKEGAIVVGVGFSYVDGKQIQDFNELDLTNAKYVTSRLNCTGKMTVLALMDNIVQLYKLNLGL